jgi:hypothetical protein
MRIVMMLMFLTSAIASRQWASHPKRIPKDLVKDSDSRDSDLTS